MKKTILCLLLALGLLLLSAAAMADDDISYSIDDGNITIMDGADEGTLRIQQGSNVVDNIDPGTTIYVGGAAPPNLAQLIVNAKVPVKITYAVNLPDKSQHSVISIADYSDVTLTLDKDLCSVYSNTSQPCIELGSGSRLTIQATSEPNLLWFYSDQNVILGPSNDQPPATVILNSGFLHNDSDSVSFISGNVNLVINGGRFEAYGKNIDVNSLIITGGELWAGSDSSTKVTYQNLSSYSNIKCAAGILPENDHLVVFRDATLPVDLTIPNGRALYFYENSNLIIPDGKTLTITESASLCTFGGILTNYGTLDILCSVPEYSVTLNNNGTMTTHKDVTMYGGSKLNNDGTLTIEDGILAIGRGTFNNTKNGTISGTGFITPRLSQSQPTSLTVESFVNGTVTLKADGQGKTALEYSDGTTWQDSPVFTGVNLSAGCTFSARYKADDHFYQASDKTSITVYPVSLNANDGTIASGKDVGYYIYGEGATLPTDVTRQNYSFAGWYDNSACTGTPTTEITKDANTAKTFWAKWTPDTYTVTLDANGGTINSGNLTGYTYGVGATLPTDVTRQNYSFAGWYANEALTGDPVTQIGATETGEKKYWAKWTADDFTVTLNANGGTINSGNLTGYSYGTGATLPTDVQKENYKFAGWYDNEALTGNPVTQIGTTETGERKYWAKWTADDFTVTLNANGGTINSGNLTGYSYGTGATLPTDVTRAGYTFAGWYDNSALTGNPVTQIGATETGEREYWAKWVVVLTDPDGAVVSGDAAFAKLPAVKVPTLVLPEGTTLGGSVMLKYVKIDTTRENTAVYDVYLVDQDGNRVALPAACTLCLPYPEGLNQNSASTYRIHILHEMDGGRSEDFDTVSGGLELTAQGLCVRISSLSPFTITWERFPEINLPQTGDSSHLLSWVALLGACCAGLWGLTRRRG